MNSSNDSLAMQRITKLVDENSFMEIGSLVTARNTDFNLADTDTPSDGVITGHGLVDGNLVFVYSQNAAVLNGTIGEMHAKKIAAVYENGSTGDRIYRLRRNAFTGICGCVKRIW